MANKPANTVQRKWMSDITEFINDVSLYPLYGDRYIEDTRMQRHHVTGRSAKHNKVHIGHWFVIPVPYELHEPNLNHEFHVGKRKNSFVEKYGNQRDIFKQLVGLMELWGYQVPPKEVCEAISDTRA